MAATVPHVETVLEVHLVKLDSLKELWLRIEVQGYPGKLVIVEDINDALMRELRDLGLFDPKDDDDDADVEDLIHEALTSIEIGFYPAIEAGAGMWLTTKDANTPFFDGLISAQRVTIQTIQLPAPEPQPA